MNDIMTPSQATDQQIDKAVANYKALLVKQAKNFQMSAVQLVLGTTDLAKAQSDIFRDRVEAVSSLITRTASVDRTRTPRAAMEATGRTPYLNETVLAGMPLGTGDTITMSFYRLDRYVAFDQLDVELAKVGLVHVVDPVGQAAINEADQEFADKYPNGNQWKNANGKFCYAFFDRWHGERRVYVNQDDGDWANGGWVSVRSM